MMVESNVTRPFEKKININNKKPKVGALILYSNIIRSLFTGRQVTTNFLSNEMCSKSGKEPIVCRFFDEKG